MLIYYEIFRRIEQFLGKLMHVECRNLLFVFLKLMHNSKGKGFLF